jgi:predicted tellurium resistance membrane protein TerC
MEWITSPEIWVAFITLLVLEIVLGIDNIIFISILAGKLPQGQQARARTTGLLAALVMRLLLLFSLSWIIGLTAPLFTVLAQEISGRDLVLIIGGLFLLVKATMEIHERLEGEEAHAVVAAGTASFGAVIFQIMLLDIVFSLDSVITAVGMVNQLPVMVAAVVGAVGVMLLSAGAISDFVNRHPTVKMLALSFLLLVGASLIAEGFDQHIPKGYIYGPIAFSVFVEALNLRIRGREQGRQEPVPLRPVFVKQGQPGRPLPVSPRASAGTAQSQPDSEEDAGASTRRSG